MKARTGLDVTKMFAYRRLGVTLNRYPRCREWSDPLEKGGDPGDSSVAAGTLDRRRARVRRVGAARVHGRDEPVLRGSRHGGQARAAAHTGSLGEFDRARFRVAGPPSRRLARRPRV